MRERREKERARERSMERECTRRESVYWETECALGEAGLKVRCGGRRRGSRVV